MIHTNKNLGKPFSSKNRLGKQENPLWFALRSFLELFGIMGCEHHWMRTNDADERDVPDCYPPNKPLGYTSPSRECQLCGREEHLVGPEVCGGKKARWVVIYPDL